MADEAPPPKKKTATCRQPRRRKLNNEVSEEQDDQTSTMAAVDATKTNLAPTTTKKTPTARQRKPPPEAMPTSVIELAGQFVKWASDLGIDGLAKLFKDQLVSALPPTKPAPSFEANMDKNRYQDVICLEDTRVKLTKEKLDDHDYIHANWIRFKDHDRTYIATQGPLENTIEDFWRMVWQEQSPIVVNLTKCCEDGKAKCAQYWPESREGAYKTFGRFTITVKKIEPEEKDKLNIYVLEVLPEGCSNSLIVRMIHTQSWPDGHTLHSSTAMLRLIKSIFRVDTLAKGPVVIHCSAGIGRTGTLVLVDYLLFRLFKSKSANLIEAFLQLRQQRASSIQREGQFIFVVVAIMAYIGHRIPQYEKQWRTLENAFREKNINAG